MFNNEQIGVSAEIAIADFFGVPVSMNYRARGVSVVVESIKPIISGVFLQEMVPRPVLHVAERQNPIDFGLENNKTLSVKTNKQKLGKAASQIIGQASSITWFNLLANSLGIANIPVSYDERVLLFKTIILARIDELLSIYWQYMFDCDYLIHIFNIVDRNENLTYNPKYVVFKKTRTPIWDASKISFTKSTVLDWNESNTVKYNGVSIGEFQVHSNRDNFKFRFNMAGITKLINEKSLKTL